MFKLPDFPSVDFTKFDVESLRNIDLSKYVPAMTFPKVEMPAVDMPTIDTAKLAEAVRDFAYLTVGFGVAVVTQARERAEAAGSQVAGLIRNVT